MADTLVAELRDNCPHEGGVLPASIVRDPVGSHRDDKAGHTQTHTHQDGQEAIGQVAEGQRS